MCVCVCVCVYTCELALICASACICWYCLSCLYIHPSFLYTSIFLARDPVSDEDVQAKPVDLAVVSNFIPRMAPKWDIIGMQLHQSVLVNILAVHTNCDPVRFCGQILNAAIESGCLPNYKTLLSCLKSDGVDLAQVTVDLLQNVVDEAEREKQHSCQETAESVSQSSSSSSTSTGDSDNAVLLGHRHKLHRSVVPIICQLLCC